MSSNTKRDKDKPQPIQVFIRLRPLSKQELEARSSTCIDILNSKELAVKQQYGKCYTFDKVFGPNVRQLDVYANVVEPLISEVLAGYNCTVFAYGQTGTGKTYTMAGGSVFSAGISWQDDQEAGIIPRALSHLFDELCLIQQQYTVRVSYLELYNEELFDLLSDNVDGKSIRLFEDQHQKGSVIINGITKGTVYNKHEVYEILQKGQEKRRTASTLINAQSSRSHTVFSIMVHTCETTVEGEELVRTGKLNLVDLAGSENISRSGAVDRRAREAGNINQSLLTLGRVIKALVERSAHIPYRESKLTRILQDSLGGRTKTSIIATISPAATCLEETLSTLDYANRARNITNRPEVNQRVSQKAWKAQFEKEIDRLRKDLHAARTGTGVYIDQENYDRLVYDSEVCKEELAEKISIVRELEQQLRNMKEQKEIQEIEWKQMVLSFQETQSKLVSCKNVLKQTIIEKQEQEHLASCYEAKAVTLHDQAHLLLGVTTTTVANFKKKIDHLRAISKENNDCMKKVSKKVMNECQEIASELIDFMVNFKGSSDRVADVIQDMQRQQLENCEMVESSGNDTVEEVRKLVNVTCQDIENAFTSDQRKSEKFLSKIQAKLQEVQDMTKWVDIKIGLEKTREELLSDLENTGKGLNKQQEITESTAEEIKIISTEVLQICNMMRSVVDRLHLLEKKVSESGDINRECSLRVNSAQAAVEKRVFKISTELQLGVDQVARLLAEAVNCVEENKQRDVAVGKILKQLQKCRGDLVQGNSETNAESKPAVEMCVQKLNSIARSNVEAAREMLSAFAYNSSKIQTQLSELNESASQHQVTLTSRLHECQENLTNFTGNALIDITPAGNTPARIHFDPNSLPQPSPKERILVRFRNRCKSDKETTPELDINAT